VFAMMWWNGPWMGGAGSAVMIIGSVLFLALIVLGVVTLLRYLLAGGNWSHSARPDPDELLAERFARGEIDEQEYRESLTTLRSTTRSQP
jgi:putative membrane protein